MREVLCIEIEGHLAEHIRSLQRMPTNIHEVLEEGLYQSVRLIAESLEAQDDLLADLDDVYGEIHHFWEGHWRNRQSTLVIPLKRKP